MPKFRLIPSGFDEPHGLRKFILLPPIGVHLPLIGHNAVYLESVAAGIRLVERVCRLHSNRWGSE